MKKLKAINLSKQGRTPEQQRNDMFKIMDEADKNGEYYDPYNIPIRATSIDKRNYSKNETHEIFISQSSDYHFTLADNVNGDEYVTHIDIPPEKLEILKNYIEQAIINYKKTERNVKNPTKIERDTKKDDRSLEGWSDIILRR